MGKLLMLQWEEVFREGQKGKKGFGKNAPALDEEANDLRQLLQKVISQIAHCSRMD